MFQATDSPDFKSPMGSINFMNRELQNDSSKDDKMSPNHPIIVESLLKKIEAHEADMADALPDQLIERIKE